MDSKPTNAERYCPHCGAAPRPGAENCWLCEAPLGEPAAAAAQPLDPFGLPYAVAPHEHAGFSFSISTLLLVMTLVAIVAALIAAEPGLGVSFCILLAPVLVRTAIVVRRRKEAGREVSLGEKVALIGGSFVVVNVILAVVCVAAVGSFCGVCLGLAAATGSERMWPIFMLFSGAVSLVVSVWLIRQFSKWVAARYRRDVEVQGPINQ